MSFYALCETTGKTVHADEPHLFGRKDLICPSYKHTMFYRSVSSNGHAAHFYSTDHAEWCDIDAATGCNEERYDYSLPGNSIQGVLELVSRQGVKKPSAHKTVAAKPRRSSGNKHQKIIRTIRQLFAFCELSDPKDVLPDGKRVMDIYCGANTAFLYVSYVNGPHLMYAQYNGKAKDGFALFFRYPSKAETQLTIALRAKEKAVLDDIASRLTIGDFALILAEFSSLHCCVCSAAQVVPFKRAQKKTKDKKAPKKAPR